MENRIAEDLDRRDRWKDPWTADSDEDGVDGEGGGLHRSDTEIKADWRRERNSF